MTQTRAFAVLLAAALLPGCTSGVAFMVAKRAIDDQQSAESYRGRYVEDLGIDETGKAQQVVREVVYQKPGKARITVVEPEERRGELVVYDGATMTFWRPRDRFGMRVRGATAPTYKQLRALVYEDVRWAWDNYHTFNRGKEKQAGRTAQVWRSYPKGDRPLFRYEAWLDEDYQIPLRMGIRDTREHTWYAMEYRDLALNVPVAPDEFSFTFPEDAVVVDFDLGERSVPREELQKSINFDLQVPAHLPADLEVEKIIRGAPGLASAVVVMRHKARLVTLGEVHSPGRMLDLGPGLTIPIGGEAGRLNFLGSFTSLYWYAGDTAMFLVGNLPYAQLVDMARKLTPAQPARVQGPLALQSYRGRYVEECPGRAASRVVREVTFQAPAKFRVEVVEPAEHAGEVTVYDGATLSTWSPQQAVGVRVGGRPAPAPEATRRRLQDRGLWNLRNFGVFFVRTEPVAGRRADLWSSVPKREEPGLFANLAWLDAQNQFPLAVELDDREGKPICTTRFEAIAFDGEVPAGAFALELPKDALVFDADLSGPGVSAEELKASGFEFLSPSVVPATLTRRRLYQAAKGPAATLLMEGGASWLTLTEARHFASTPDSWASIPVTVGGRAAALQMIGEVNSLTWAAGNVSFTLMGNLPLAEMVKVGASVSPRQGEAWAEAPFGLASYKGRLVEHAAGLPAVAREVSYRAPDLVSAKVVEPASRAGERVAFDGAALHFYWPQQLFGSSFRGTPPLTEREGRDALAQGGLWTLRHNDVRFAGVETVAGRPADRYELAPKRAQPFVWPTTVWLDQASSLPLKTEIRDRPDHVWYAVEFEKVEVNAADDGVGYGVAFPGNTLKFDFDLRDPDQPVEALQRGLNFKLLVPTALPDGMRVTRVVKGRHALPMAAVVSQQGARWLTLTEIRRAVRSLEKDSGIPVQVGPHAGSLNMLGGFISVSWLQGDTALTLVGNVSLAEVMRAAASVAEPGRK